ncbi:MAG: prepilin peptidase [Paracoccaceae bacterium]
MAVLAISTLVILVYGHVAWTDFVRFRIRNQMVLLLLGLYPLFGLAQGWADLRGDLVAGLVLFGMGFGFWLAGLMGAGDAKLALPVGLFCGIKGLLPYAVLLLAFSLAMLVLFRLGRRPGQRRSHVGRRLREMAELGQVPYAIPMLCAGGIILALRALAHLG